ncbi:MAG: hypothetical protein LBV43_09315, partial [Prevotella sp.]|nr:hypothetical protein [Prevotella sp.]
MKFIDPDGRPPSKAQIAALLAWAKADAAGKEIEEPDPPKKDNNSLLSIYFNRLLGAVGLSPDQWNSDDPAVLEDASQ